MQEIMREIKVMDEHEDHSELTDEQRTEIQLFHSIKSDPYFRHHMRNHLRVFAEENDQMSLHAGTNSRFLDQHLYDHVKFDHLNPIDVAKELLEQKREVELDFYHKKISHDREA